MFTFPPRAGGMARRGYRRFTMIYSDLTKKALRLSFEAHKDQVDKSGMPYVFHPFHLAEHMHTSQYRKSSERHFLLRKISGVIEMVSSL